MDKDKLKKLGSDWKELNHKYDCLMLEFIDSSESTALTPEKKEEMKKMQQELFNLEVQIFNSFHI